MSARIGIFFAVIAVVVAGLFVLGVFDKEADGSETSSSGLQPTAGEAGSPNPTIEDKPKGGRLASNPYRGRNETPTATIRSSSDVEVVGTVVSEDQSPVAQAKVRLFRDVSQIRGRPMEGEQVAVIETNSTGQFAFRGLIPGDTYVIRGSHPDHTTARAFPIDPALPATLDVKVVLLSGRGLMGQVTDDAGVPLEGAEVAVFDTVLSTTYGRTLPERKGLTNKDGRYEVEHLTPGLKKVIASKEGYATNGIQSLDLRDLGKDARADFELGRGLSISGLVVDSETGQPVVGALITARAVGPVGRKPRSPLRPAASDVGEVVPTGGEIVERSAQPVARAARGNPREITRKAFLVVDAETDADGRFVLSGLIEARYSVAARSPGYQPRRGRTLDPTRHEDVRFELQPSPRVLGRVVDDETGEPLRAFSIAASPSADPGYLPANTRQNFESEDGTYTYVDIRPGQHHLIAEAPGYAGGRAGPIRIAPKEELTGIEIRMSRGATVMGRIVDGNGQGVGGAEVSLASDAQGDLPPNPFTEALRRQVRLRGGRRTVSKADGTFRIECVMAGNYRIQARCNGFAEAPSMRVRCEDRGDVRTGDLTIVRGATLTGVVRLDNGQPDPKAKVIVSAHGGGLFSKSVDTDADGRFTVDGLAPGEYKAVVAQRNGVFELSVVLDPNSGKARYVTIRGGETHELEL